MGWGGLLYGECVCVCVCDRVIKLYMVVDYCFFRGFFIVACIVWIGGRGV